MKHIAVFGDVHGHLRLMFQLCRRWQQKHKAHLDGILQCGDLGFFPDLSRVDKATRRYSRRDPEELGFAKYFRLPAPSEGDILLERTFKGPPKSFDTLRCRVIWCHGNHEDFEELDRIIGGEASAPVDVFGVLHLLRSGHITEIAGIRVAAVGGAPEMSNLRDPRHVCPDACQRLLEGGAESFDVLISHGSPKGIGGPTDERGSELLRWVVEECRPKYHFYAHHTQHIPPGTIGRTKCYWLNDVSFQTHKKAASPYAPLRDGCMGVLVWAGSKDHRFQIQQESWLREVTVHTWRYL